MRRLKTYLSVLLIICLSWRADAQNLTHQFVDPCTGQIYYFTVPAQGTTVFFLGQSRSFVPGDVQNGTLAAWINQVYTDYRKVAPCGQQQGQVNQNLITSQIISNTVQSVVGSIMSQAQSAASGTMQSVSMSGSGSSSGGNDAASKNNKDNDNKKKKDENNTSSSQANGVNNTMGSSSNSSSSNNSTTGGTSGSSGNGIVQGKDDSKKEEKGEEVAATTTMNVDQQNQNDSKSNGNSGGSKKSGTNNPVIVSSDLTTAQNLDKTFTPILNLSMSQSSMTGMSSWGLTSMIWFNFKQFALSGKYTKISFSKNGKLKWVHNVNLTGVYTYGNVLGFVGYSGILNAGKWGIAGFNTSAAATLITEDKNTFISPSITAFYTKPFKASKRLTISPELYIISTPLIYSTKEKVTTTDRTFSAFLGSGFDYQLTKRFKFNLNYKANLSTNPDFPILSFFLVGSKINL